MHAACEKGNLEIVKILLEHGAEKDAENVDGFTPLLRACTNGHLFVIKELAARGANIYKTTKVIIDDLLLYNAIEMSYINCIVERKHGNASGCS